MTTDNRSVFLKQFRHLRLRQPHGFVLHSDIDCSLSIIGLIYDDLVFHGVGFMRQR